jgi:hypothetical protein
MEVVIGLRHAPKEITLNMAGPAQDIHDAVATAITENQPLITLTDKHGRAVLIPTAALAYVEIGSGEARRVGFSA